MIPLAGWPVLVLSIALVSPSFAGVVPVPDNGCYHSAFMEDGGYAGFTTLAGKEVAIEMFYEAWGTMADFPESRCNTIVANGAIPHLTWEPWNYAAVDANYSLQTIIDGNHDTYIRHIADQIKAWGKPLFLRPAHEMNGTWYPWSGPANGGATIAGYGDAAKADGPERYVDAWRHIHDIFTDAGVTNVDWIWAPNVIMGSDAVNTISNYYPGNAYVDWLGIDGYNFATSGWQSFSQVFQSTYDACVAISSQKPIMIAEYSCAEVGGDKAAWIADAHQVIKNSYTHLKAVTWFNVNKEADWRINSGSATLAAYQSAIADPYFLGTIPDGTPDTAINVALDKPVSVSTAETTTTAAEYAVDGDLSTRWSSAFADSQTLVVDLQEPYDLREVVIYWEAAYAKAYRIEVSEDAVDWTTVYETDNAGGGTMHSPFTARGRYVKMYGITRAGAYGFSLYELVVHGSPAPGTAAYVRSAVDNEVSFCKRTGQSFELRLGTPAASVVSVYTVSGRLVQQIKSAQSSQVVELPRIVGCAVVRVETRGIEKTFKVAW